MEDALDVRHDKRGQIIGTRAVVRYADDFVVFCESRADAKAVIETLKGWLAERGLTLSEEKTRIVHLMEGFDFLGWNVRHYKDGNTRTGYKLRITPSDASVKNLRRQLRAVWRQYQGADTPAVLQALNPIVRGWANYHRTAVASRTFAGLDDWMFHRATRYAKRRHPTKPQYWRNNRYWGRLNAKRQDHWVFGDKQTGGYLLKFSWFPIERHVLVRGTASPDDPTLTAYWAHRRRYSDTAAAVQLPARKRWLSHAQHHRCPLCGESIHNGEEIHEHHLRGRAAGDGGDNVILVHLYCHQRVHAKRGVIAPVGLA